MIRIGAGGAILWPFFVLCLTTNICGTPMRKLAWLNVTHEKGGNMRIALAALPLAAMLSSAAMAEISKEHRKAFSLVADAITSGQTCSEIGFAVDFDAIVEFRRTVEDAAIADANEPEDVRAEIDERIELKYNMLKRRFNRDELNARSDSQRGQYRRYWAKQCKRLAENEAIPGLFTKPD